jgi:hypothetical protein
MAPTFGLPIGFFLLSDIDLLISICYQKSKPEGSLTFRPGSNPNQRVQPMAQASHVHSIPADPIHLAIERHKNAARLWAAAVKIRDAFPDGANPMTLEQQAQVDAAVAGARLPLIDAGLDLIETAPTTIGGIVAALEYARDQLQGDGDTMPADIMLDPELASAIRPVGDTIGWLDVFVDTLADASSDILARQGEQS